MTALQQRANPQHGHACRASCAERMPRSTQSCTRRSTLRRVTESLTGCARTIANMQKSENLWASQAHRSLASMFISDGRLTAVRRAVHRGQTSGSLLLLMLAMLHESKVHPLPRPSKASKFRLLAATAAPSGLGFGGALRDTERVGSGQLVAWAQDPRQVRPETGSFDLSVDRIGFMRAPCLNARTKGAWASSQDGRRLLVCEGCRCVKFAPCGQLLSAEGRARGTTRATSQAV